MLEVGDVVADINYGFNGSVSVISKHTIGRVTATQAIVDVESQLGRSYTIRFNRELVHDGIARKKGADTWSRECWRLVTPEIQESVDTAMRIQRKANAVHDLITIPVRKWSEDQLDGVLAVFEENPIE